LVRAGRSPEELAQEFEPTAQSIRNWVGQAECDAGRRGNGLTTAEAAVEAENTQREDRTLRRIVPFARQAARGRGMCQPDGGNSLSHEQHAIG
jgi:transposase